MELAACLKELLSETADSAGYFVLNRANDHLSSFFVILQLCLESFLLALNHLEISLAILQLVFELMDSCPIFSHLITLGLFQLNNLVCLALFGKRQFLICLF